MKTYSSSLIKISNDYCPAALGFYEKGTPTDDSQKAYGVASHAVIESIGKKNAKSEEEKRTVSEAVVRRLITEGRMFRGRHEPPMQPDHAFLGRDVALKWLEFNELPEDADYEIEFSARLRDYEIVALHDCVWTEDHSDEYGERKVRVTRDWKGWQGTESELETIQRKAQAVTLAYPKIDADEIRLEICNLQTHRIFSKTIVLDEEGLALIDQWAKDLNTVCNAVDQTREARPGVGCLSCPYNHVCADRLMFNASSTADMIDNAKYLAFLEVERANTIAKLKATQELPVKIEGGYVGWKLHPDNKVVEGAHNNIYDAWFVDPVEITEHTVKSLLASLNLDIGNLNSFVKGLWAKEDDAMKEDFLDSCIEKRNGRRFGVWEQKEK